MKYRLGCAEQESKQLTAKKITIYLVVKLFSPKFSQAKLHKTRICYIKAITSSEVTRY